MATVDFNDFPNYKAGSMERVVRETRWRNVRSDQVVVGRTRFERLRQAVAELMVFCDAVEEHGHDTPCTAAIRERLRGISLADLDPLP